MYKKICGCLFFLGVIVLLPTTVVFAENVQFSITLRRGSTGQDVLRLQEFLKTMPDMYPEGLVTGYFGVLTEKAVKRFQAKHGIQQVGIVGPKTRAKLNSLILSHRQEIGAIPGQNEIQKQQLTVSLADQFIALENELLGAKASGSSLAPDHYERIKRDLAVFESKGYPANEIGRLRELALKLAPHLQTRQKNLESQPEKQEVIKKEDKTPVLKNLGVHFEPWDKNTNRAGAFIFLPSENKLFLEYGAEVESSEGGTKILPTFEYRIASDADVFAVMDGVVTNVTYQDRNQDYAIHIQPELNSQWILEHDHVRNPRVSKGDIVKAGDILGKVGTLGGDLGRTEIMLWNASGVRPLTYCPFKYFDPGLISEYQQKISRHMKDWEEFKGNSNFYSENKHIFPGCVYESIPD